jgi:hypothetical protein
MEASAKQRMDVYQEGQRAFNAGAMCPYARADWRAGTWEKGRAAAQKYHEGQAAAQQTTPADDFDTWREAFLVRAGFTYGWWNLERSDNT